MKKANITYDKANMLAPLTRAYLRNEKEISHLFNFESTTENVERIIDQRKKLSPINRTVLVDALKAQYANFTTSKKVNSNINKLSNIDTYTVVTGHQLNLFTGPLYFIYKIISAIKAAKELNEKYSQYHFVPVYWMATEDADFEEINHTFVNNEKLVWDSKQTGMVGEFSTSDIQSVISSLNSVLADNISANEIKDLMHQAYVNHSNLADATRYLVNELFKNDGLVIIDGNSKKLKELFSPVVKDELLHKSSYKLVSETISSFSLNYSAQVAPREINLFYAIQGVRERIIETENGFEVNDTDINFSETQILEELKNHPERFSPNVILRPVYQEMILPNVMYIGGGAELAYWLELKSLFDYHKISYPLLQIRNSFLVMDGNSVKKVLQCCLSLEELFLPENDQVSILLKGDNPFQEKLLKHKKDVDHKISTLIREIEEFDPALIPSLKSTKAGFLSELRKLDKKIKRSVKRKNSTKLNRLSAIRKEMYPGGSYQERRTNVIQMLLPYGMNFLETIKQNTDPFDKNMTILYPDDMDLKRDK